MTQWRYIQLTLVVYIIKSTLVPSPVTCQLSLAHDDIFQERERERIFWKCLSKCHPRRFRNQIFSIWQRLETHFLIESKCVCLLMCAVYMTIYNKHDVVSGIKCVMAYVRPVWHNLYEEVTLPKGCALHFFFTISFKSIWMLFFFFNFLYDQFNTARWRQRISKSTLNDRILRGEKKEGIHFGKCPYVYSITYVNWISCPNWLSRSDDKRENVAQSLVAIHFTVDIILLSINLHSSLRNSF